MKRSLLGKLLGQSEHYNYDPDWLIDNQEYYTLLHHDQPKTKPLEGR